MKQIIFDLDDTLYKDKRLREKREKAIIKFLGEKFNEYKILKKEFHTIECFEKLGYSRKDFFNIIDKVEINLKNDLKLQKILLKLHKRYRLIVLSNVSNYVVEKTLDKLGILFLIDEYYGGDDFSYSKPHKDCFFMISKGDIAIGNNFKKDIEIPKMLGALTILISKSNEIFSADHIIKSIYDINKIIG
ncbi:MAG: HAD hydrolase-like protein [Nanoarchaeota archaeon]|nr:HAD hydrolase-like protein [Nanoarchaeota archaeon]